MESSKCWYSLKDLETFREFMGMRENLLYKRKHKLRDRKTGRFIGKSLVEIMMPLENLYNLQMLKMQQELLIKEK